MSIQSMISEHGGTWRFHRMQSKSSGNPRVPDGETFPGWLQSLSGDAIERFAAREMYATHVLYLDRDPGSLKVGDVAVEENTGRKIAVSSNAVDQAGMGRLFAVYVTS